VRYRSDGLVTAIKQECLKMFVCLCRCQHQQSVIYCTHRLEMWPALAYASWHWEMFEVHALR